MTRRNLLLASAALMAGSAQAQDTKLTIMPEPCQGRAGICRREAGAARNGHGPAGDRSDGTEWIELDPVPLGLVAKVPEVRNYEYFVAGGKVMFVEPYTRKILQIVQ